MTDALRPLDGAHWPGGLRPYQRTAVRRVAERWDAGRRRTWVVLPPGAGKTLVGLEAARELGRRTVVFAPNTAIQGQWTAHWRAFERPDGCTAGTRRDLRDPVTVLTYQSLAVFDPDAETDEDGRPRASPRERLHGNGAALVAALHRAGPITVLLDECHHLLQVWGRLLDEVLAELDDAYVIGLTGTPAASLTAAEARLVDRLFGPPVVGASIPALVRDGHLAPFAELAYLTAPTRLERDHLAEQGTRFAEMCTDLLAPGFADTDFLPWVDARFGERATADGERLPWPRLAAQEPELTDAVLRLHHAGLCALPEGARMLERHRHPPRAEDWTALIGDYARNRLDGGSARDRAARERIRAALPSVGYHLTARGVRAGASPADRVLARSAAKSYATVEILSAESASIGARLRALVLCDHERAAARPPARLRGVLADDAGSARLQLELLAADARTEGLSPMLVTGRTVAAAPGTAADFIAFAARERPDLDLRAVPSGPLHQVEGGWSSRIWVALATRFFEAGRCQVLVGTRALLGEGWDARGVNTVVDLTTATTSTAVVQSRGRALRLDPAWPEKTANTWTVVCSTDGHPRGSADWNRFVRKHEGYLGVDAEGEVMSGVAHVDPAFSPFEPPPEEELDAVNARMLARAERRDETRRRWSLGASYRDELLPTLRVRAARGRAAAPAGDVPPPEPPTALPAAAGAIPGPGAPPASSLVPLATLPTRAAALLVAVPAPLAALLAPVFAVLPAPLAALLALLLDLLVCLGVILTFFGAPLLVVVAFVALPWWALIGLFALPPTLLMIVEGRREQARVRGVVRMQEIAAEPVDTARYASAVADGLRAAGRSEAGAEAVRIRVDADGVYRYTLTGAGATAAEEFATALDEVLAPLVGTPRYLIPRYLPDAPANGRDARARARAQLAGRPRANRAAYHAVPGVFGRNKEAVRAFTGAWNTWVSAGEAVYAASAAGREILAEHYGTDPTGTATARRMSWS
ncbi:DEAD/DEAH box helicase family protein [Nocardiopsis potens]|uniref:DEAD/DEAH box helicase family protein n=1 Tax=Nocardiopsis potens TaxID=1246458 RepID=UPI0003497066|nr:DEAD/DEAH box helicase family protein [Nocardiopsis potens]